jgi:carbon-monoxide dehydrogenase medium subunit
MSLWSNYVIPDSVAGALQALATAPGPARPVAGGTDLLLELQQGRHSPLDTLVDITHIPELNCLEMRQERLFIGAAVNVRTVTTSPLVRTHAPAVSEACDLIGGPQVRNTATLGGNVAHALPAADGMIALCAMDAQAEIASPEGTRLEPILNLFRGPGLSSLQPQRDLLVGFYIQARRPGQASAFNRIMRPQGVALPILNTALWLQRTGDRIQSIRIVIGPSGPVPQRARALEEALTGYAYAGQPPQSTQEIIAASLRFRSSPQRASAEYRYQLSQVLLESTIQKAWQRAESIEVV